MRMTQKLFSALQTVKIGFTHYFHVSDGFRRWVTFIGVSALIVSLFVGFFYVWNRMKIVQVGYEIAELEKKNKELKNRKRELLLEMASLESPGELEKKASRQGLRFPSIGKVIHVP